MSIFTHLFARKKIRDEQHRQAEIVRKATIIEAAEQSEIWKIVMEEIAAQHASLLSQSHNGLWFAGGATALLDLTKTLEGYKWQRDRIMEAVAREKEKGRRIPVKDFYTPPHAEPHTL